jgi:hypothetical protein
MRRSEVHDTVIEKLWFNDSMRPRGESSAKLDTESGVFQPTD